MNLWSAFIGKSVDSLEQQDKKEFWREVIYANLRRVRLLLIISVISYCILIYAVNIQNTFRLPEGDNRTVLITHSILLSGSFLLLMMVAYRFPKTSADVRSHHHRVLVVVICAVVLSTGLFLWTVIKTNGHPIFAFIGILVWCSSLLIPARLYVLMVLALEIILFSIMALLPLPTDNVRFTAEARLSSVLTAAILIATGSLLFRTTVEAFRQRKLVEKERNIIARLNEEATELNRELERGRNVLENQAAEIEIINTKLQEQNQMLQERALQIEERNEELYAALRDLKDTQSQLVQSERMSAVGMLTAGVMHEINNPNAAIHAALEELQLNTAKIREFFLSLLNEEDKQSPEVKRFLAMSDNAERAIDIASVGSQRVKSIVASLQHFTKHQEDGAKELPLEESLKTTIDIFRYQFKEVRISVRFKGASIVKAHLGEINQVFLNLFVNAAQAGASIITLSDVSSDDEVLRVSVEDNGAGMTPEEQANIFEPFFSTKGIGNSGLGLSISKQLVERHKGKISCSSEKGKGTTFLIELPRFFQSVQAMPTVLATAQRQI